MKRLALFYTLGSIILFYTLGRIAVLERQLHKAQVCNKVFVLYLKHNYGMHINLDRIYEDGVKWVDEPEYQ